MLTADAIYQVVRRLTQQSFAEPMSMHDFRRAAATSLAIEAPDKIGLASGPLQHTRTDTTGRHYNLAGIAQASRRRRSGRVAGSKITMAVPNATTPDAPTLRAQLWMGNSMGQVQQAAWKSYLINKLMAGNGGESGIRTRDTVPRIHTFQACAFNHSATSPSLRFATAGHAAHGFGKSLIPMDFAGWAWVPSTRGQPVHAPDE